MLVFLCAAPAHAKRELIKIGVIAAGDAAPETGRWESTAGYLTEHLPGHVVVLMPVRREDADALLGRGELEFVIADALTYAEFERRYQAEVIASARVPRAGRPTAYQAGVLVAAASRPDIRHIDDLRGRTVAALSSGDLAGWLAPRYALHGLGIERDGQSTRALRLDSPEAVVRAVLDGAADAGMLPAGALEQLSAAGGIDGAAVRVLNRREPIEAFPFVHSTPLYPGWALARVGAVPDGLAERIAGLLIERAGASAGTWTAPKNYFPVHRLMEVFEIGPYRHAEKVTLAQIADQYWQWLAFVTALLAGVGMVAVRQLRLNRRLRISERNLRLAQQIARMGDVRRDLSNDHSEWSAQVYEMLGITDGSPLDQAHFLGFVHEEDRPRVSRSIREAAERKQGFSLEYRIVTPDAGTRLVCETSQYLTEGLNLSGYLLSTIQDITERKRVEEALFEQKERAEVTLQSIADGVITTSAQGLVEYLNPEAERLTGWERRAARGRALAEVLRIIDPVTRRRTEGEPHLQLLEGAQAKSQMEARILSQEGNEYAVTIAAAPIRDRSGAAIGSVFICHDETAAQSMARQIEYQATHDALTGLLNRREFENRLAKALGGVVDGRVSHMLCYIDLDQFKVVNDTCGHTAGDALLKQLAAVLYSKFNDASAIARMGGDEFALLLEDCTLEQARSVAERLQQTIREFRFVYGGSIFDVGVSISIVPMTQASDTLTDVLSAADSACYVAKDLGRNRIHVYQADDNELARRHGEMRWVNRIKQALREERFCLYRQVIRPLAAPVQDEHWEVLVRMQQPDGELIPPGAFIPAAERYHIMPALDRWVVRASFDRLREQHASLRRKAVVCNINLSGQSLGDQDFLDFVREQLERSGVDPGKICFEITESAAMDNLQDARRFITGMRALGCRFALDDFGIGLSSFGYLKSLPVDFLKIDGSFVRNIAEDPIDFAMVDAINRIGHQMGIQTVAEYVENAAILAKLEQIGIDYVQGYGVSMPQPM